MNGTYRNLEVESSIWILLWSISILTEWKRLEGRIIIPLVCTGWPEALCPSYRDFLC